MIVFYLIRLNRVHILLDQHNHSLEEGEEECRGEVSSCDTFPPASFYCTRRIHTSACTARLHVKVCDKLVQRSPWSRKYLLTRLNEFRPTVPEFYHTRDQCRSSEMKWKGRRTNAVCVAEIFLFRVFPSPSRRDLILLRRVIAPVCLPVLRSTQSREPDRMSLLSSRTNECGCDGRGSHRSRRALG